MIHRHLLTVLHSSLSYYLDAQNEQKVISLLDSTSIGVETLKKTLQKLRADPPSLQVHAEAGTAKLPLVVAQMQSRRVTERPLGHVFRGEESVISKQDARIEICTRTEEETELLSDLCFRGLHQSRSDFLRNGYLFFSLEGQDELSAQEQMTAEDLGLFIRRLSVSAMIQEDTSAIAITPTLGTLTIGLIPNGRVSFFSDTL
jgi:hypothetical protein